MQLLQKNAFEDLDSEVQGQLIELAKGMDQNAFEHACETLRVQSEFQRNHLDSSERSNKQRLFAAVVMAVLLLACGTGITIMLLNAGENQLAFNLMMSGLACVGMLLGGVGIGRLFNSGGQ